MQSRLSQFTPTAELLENVARDLGYRTVPRMGAPYRIRVFEGAQELVNINVSSSIFLMGSDRTKTHLADTDSGAGDAGLEPMHAA